MLQLLARHEPDGWRLVTASDAAPEDARRAARVTGRTYATWADALAAAESLDLELSPRFGGAVYVTEEPE